VLASAFRVQEMTMGFYSRVIFPRLCDLLLGTPLVAKHRRKLLAHAHGRVLEIGFGTGLNLPHYPEHVRKIVAVDPNIGMHRLARRRIRKSGIAVDHRVLSGEQLPFEDRTFDCVVSTVTLCSIERVEQAVSEVYRVLERGGHFLFLEHGLSPEPEVQAWQRRLNWLEVRLGDGCRLDRNMRALVASQPFAALEMEEFYIEMAPRTHGYLYRGVATK
jgi:ubiquinone/menaquinone biosynthesis C-methylase UbiE